MAPGQTLRVLKSEHKFPFLCAISGYKYYILLKIMKLLSTDSFRISFTFVPFNCALEQTINSRTEWLLSYTVFALCFVVSSIICYQAAEDFCGIRPELPEGNKELLSKA